MIELLVTYPGLVFIGLSLLVVVDTVSGNLPPAAAGPVRSRHGAGGDPAVIPLSRNASGEPPARVTAAAVFLAILSSSPPGPA